MKEDKILIVGAGIAGLSFARLLEKQKKDFVIIEKRSSGDRDGAAIALPFNATRALKHMGLLEDVLKHSFEVSQIRYLKYSGAVLSTADLRQAPFENDKFIATKRTDLHNILLKGIEKKIHYDTSLETFKSYDTHAVASCSNSKLNGEYKVIVAADGINSTLRTQSFLAEPNVDYGIICWRWLVDYVNHDIEPTYMIGKTDVFMAYPYSKDSLYCYAHIYEKSDSFKQLSDDLSTIQSIFGNYGAFVPRILDLSQSSEFIKGKLISVPSVKLRKKRVVFIGDASSGCSPLLQQGAAAAFEDAIELAAAIEANGIEIAPKVFAEQRMPRASWVLKTSDAPLKAVKAMESDFVCAIRNFIIRLGGPLNVKGWKQLAKK